MANTQRTKTRNIDAEARALASVALAEPNQYLSLTLNGELFAIDILYIKEILEYGAPTKVPMMPKHICGVINLRGGMVPVIDLSALLDQPTITVTKRSCIIIVELERDAGELSQSVGLLVEGVNEVVEIDPVDVKVEPTFGMGVRADFIGGIAQCGDRFVILLDILRVILMAEQEHVVT